jgi:Flp pilus assembly protein TadG
MTRRSHLLTESFRRFRRDSRGAAAAEFAMVVPLFVILVFGTINTCLLIAAFINMQYAAQRTARCLSVDIAATCTPGNVDTFAKALYNGPSVTGLTFASTTPACGTQVTATGSFELMTGFSASTVNLSAQACYPKI